MARFARASQRRRVVRALAARLRRDRGHDLRLANNTRTCPRRRGGRCVARRPRGCSVRVEVVNALRVLGPHAAGAARALARVVADGRDDDSLREDAAKALAAIGKGARSALPALERVAKRGKPSWVAEAAKKAASAIRAAL